MNQLRDWIPHSASSVGAAEAEAVRAAISRNYVGHGSKAAELEAKIAEATGRTHAFGVASGFHALTLAVRALDMLRPSLIALPAVTCASVLAAVQAAGHRVWLTDILEADLTIDPRGVPPEAAAVIAPHAYGAPVNSGALERLGRPWIEDCATLPLTGTPPRAGTSGTLAVFSFGSTKYITGGSGGMLLTDDKGLAARVADLLDFERFESHGQWTSRPEPSPGRLADLNASIALVQWDRLGEFAERRRTIAEVYQRGLEDLGGLSLPGLRAEHGFYRYIIRTHHPAAGIAAALRERGIDARDAVNPWLHRVAPSALGGPWPVADRWREHLLSLPIYPRLTDEAAYRIVKAMRELLRK